MTIAEFLHWQSGDDTRYELIDGVPVAMAPPNAAHQILTVNISRRIAEALDRRPPCTTRSEAGILLPHRFHSYFQADIAVTRRPHEPGQHAMPDPILIVEILSPATEDHDRKVKLPQYRRIPSVQEIVLVDSQHHYCEVHRRIGNSDRWQSDLITDPEATVHLESIGAAVPLSQFYANVAVEPLPAAPRRPQA